MSKLVSNLYASRIYAEHPIALWSLDDETSYISKLSTSQKDLANWSLYNLEEVVSPSAVYGEPVAGNPKYYSTIISASASLSASALASAINTELDLDPDKKTISINTFFYDTAGFVLTVDIGFKYNNTLYFNTLSGPENERWEKISYTMPIPEGNVDIYGRC